MRADLIASDRHGDPALLVEVESRTAGRDVLARLISSLEALVSNHALDGRVFGMLVDPEAILVVVRGSGLAGAEVGPFGPYSTTEVLRHYDADFGGEGSRSGSERGFGLYLEGLVASWIEDLIAPWTGGGPPLRKELAVVGLLGRLEGGSVIEESLVRDDPVR